MNSFDIFESSRYLTEKDSLLFRREEDLLNVFKHSIQYHQFDDNLNFNPELDLNDEHEGLIKKYFNSNSINSPNSYHLEEDDTFSNWVESVEATVDNLESSEYQNDNYVYDKRCLGYMKISNNDESCNTTYVSKQSQNIASNLEVTSTAELDSQNLNSVTIIPENNMSEKNDELPSGKRAKRVKLFSRRKDVIIKTLLRKWRKFFLKDFNSKTNYLRTAKRKFGSSAYKNLLWNYLNKIFDYDWSESLFIFMAAFLYQQDLEDSMDLFISEKYSRNRIQILLNQIHEILYKYSHQKFHEFSKNPEFRHVFMKFNEIGSEDWLKDVEYAAGIEIIIDQLY